MQDHQDGRGTPDTQFDTAKLLSDIPKIAGTADFSVDEILAEFSSDADAVRPESVPEISPSPQAAEDEAPTPPRAKIVPISAAPPRQEAPPVTDDTDDDARQEDVPKEKPPVLDMPLKDDIENYFGPQAGLAAEISPKKVFEDDVYEDDWDDDDDAKKPGLFSRLFRRKEPVIEEDVPEDAAPVPAPEPEEDIPPEEAAGALIASMGYIRLRHIASFLLFLGFGYLMFAGRFGLPVPVSYVEAPFPFLFLCAALQIAVMGLCYDTVVTGVYDLFHLRPKMEAIVAVASFASLAHTVSILVMPAWEGYFPYGVVTTASLLCASFFRQAEKKARVRTYKNTGFSSRPYLVVNEDAAYAGAPAIMKYKAKRARYFVAECEKDDIQRRVFRYLAPLVLIAGVVFAAVASFGKGEGYRFLWCYAAIMAAASPLSLCLPFALPFLRASKRLTLSGSAIAGYSAAEAMSADDYLVVSDGDLFPPGTVSLNGLKIFGGHSVERVISSAASLISASGSSLMKPFMELLQSQTGSLQKITNFQHYENGGIGGEIAGDAILAGNVSFMMRTGIKIPGDISIKNAVYVAINLELAGIFAVNYTAQAGIKSALISLVKGGVTPVLAVRDFNLTPQMLDAKFKISSDITEYPPIADRLSLSNPDRMFASRPRAVIGREGLQHMAETVLCARGLKRAATFNLWLTVACMLIGMGLMFYLVFAMSPAAASPWNMLLFSFLWMIPQLLISGWVKR
ncbi:hypothetical protein LJC32_03295 [Oscillospiraceae bacterium OttesenSCG-928-F05]|nr:hypothetical protein [Oscillospiraceae bacterium OttesenSCG-928-F05]